MFYAFFFFKQKTAYEMRISDWSSDVCSSDLRQAGHPRPGYLRQRMSTNSQSETSPDRFVELTRAGRVWAIAAVHGDAGRLAAIHDGIGARFQSGDRLVYLGDLMGGGAVPATLAAALRFRRPVPAPPPLNMHKDVGPLRGPPEAKWPKRRKNT